MAVINIHNIFLSTIIDATSKEVEQTNSFESKQNGVRRLENGDPMMNRRGKVVGTITSCAIDSDCYLLSKDYVNLGTQKRDTTLYIYQLGDNRFNWLPTAEEETEIISKRVVQS